MGENGGADFIKEYMPNYTEIALIHCRHANKWEPVDGGMIDGESEVRQGEQLTHGGSWRGPHLTHHRQDGFSSPQRRKHEFYNRNSGRLQYY